MPNRILLTEWSTKGPFFSLDLYRPPCPQWCVHSRKSVNWQTQQNDVDQECEGQCCHNCWCRSCAQMDQTALFVGQCQHKRNTSNVKLSFLNAVRMNQNHLLCIVVGDGCVRTNCWDQIVTIRPKLVKLGCDSELCWSTMPAWMCTSNIKLSFPTSVRMNQNHLLGIVVGGGCVRTCCWIKIATMRPKLVIMCWDVTLSSVGQQCLHECAHPTSNCRFQLLWEWTKIICWALWWVVDVSEPIVGSKLSQSEPKLIMCWDVTLSSVGQQCLHEHIYVDLNSSC